MTSPSVSGLKESGDSDSKSESKISGQAYFDGPISGADVTVRDMNDFVLYQGAGVTDSEGNFTVSLENLPSEFTIEVSGGTVTTYEYAPVNVTDPFEPPPEIISSQSYPFDYNVQRYVDHFDSNATYAVNIISSIYIHLYLENVNNNWSKEELYQYVSDYLSLPGCFSVEETIQTSNWYDEFFNADYFPEDMENEWGYTDYYQFIEFVVNNIEDFAQYETDEIYGSNSRAATPEWKRTISTIPPAIKETQLAVNKHYSQFNSYVRNQQVFSVVDLGFNIIGFVLNGVQEATADTEGGRILGTILSFLEMGGPDPVVNALFDNLKAIQESIKEVSKQINAMHNELAMDTAEIKSLIKEANADVAFSEIQSFCDKLYIFEKYKAGDLTPVQKTKINDWVKDTLAPQNISQKLVYLDNLITGNTLDAGKGIFDYWIELANRLGINYSGKRDLIYYNIRKNFATLIFYQTMGTNLLVEANNRIGDKVAAKANIDKLRENLKKQTELYEQKMEELAIDFEWNIYSNPDLDHPEKTCPDFCMNNGEHGILSDVDRFVRKYVHGTLETYTENGIEKTRLVSPDMITIRVLAPYNTGNEAMGLVGFSSSRYWWGSDQFPDMPDVPREPPGSDTMDKQFSFKRIVLETTDMTIIDTEGEENFNSTTRVITGRSPFENRKTPVMDQVKWRYQLIKIRRVLDMNNGKAPDPTRTFMADFKTSFETQVSWHPNLINKRPPQSKTEWDLANIAPIAIRPGQVGYCESFGFYGLKAQQPVRLMNYPGQSICNDWRYTGWKEQDKGVMFANKWDAYTFFELWPLGQGWYAMRDALGTSWKDESMACPFNYTDRTNYSAPGNGWVNVGSSKSNRWEGPFLYSDEPCIGLLSAFQISYLNKSQQDQPASKLYSMKVNYPSYEDPRYLKWASWAFQWNRYKAEATEQDAGTNHDCWVMIMPDYQPTVDYWLTATK